MLRGEHVMARLSRGRLVPHKLSPEDERAKEVSEALVALYADHVGKPRARLERELALTEEDLGPHLDPRRGFKIVRALAKLLEERATWAFPTPYDPYTIRTRLFELAAALPELPSATGTLLEGSTREDVLARVSGETGVEDPATLMYSDRQGAQLLAEFEKPSPEALISRYNVAQIQGVLYSAKDLTVDLGEEADARLVFHYVKLLGLIYRLETTTRGYRLRLDGPLSLFGSTRKYGLRLAKLLPALLLTSHWKLHASVSWKGRESILELDSETPHLASHYKGPNNVADEGEGGVREALVKAWSRTKEKGGWELEQETGILPVPQLKTALVSDFAFRNTETGEKVHLEILGFWSERHLVERAELLREAARRGHRFLIAAPESLGTSPETLSAATQGEVIPFKTRLDVKSILAALQEDTTNTTADG
jgi:predicted nuclease of restriction endonuclease-like RecB superfamily